MKYEYKRKVVPEYHYGKSSEKPEDTVLRGMGAEGWLLCAVGERDGAGARTMYFVKERED